MNIYLIIAILLANLISIGIVYQFIKRMGKKQILLFIGISVGIMYVLISGVYWMSGIGVEQSIHNASKNFVLYLFVPVNVILFVPFFAYQYMKLVEKKIDPEGFFKKIIALIVFLILVLTIEYFYFRNIQTNIKEINRIQEEIKGNEVETQNRIHEEENEIQKNTTVEVKNNAIVNEERINNTMLEQERTKVIQKNTEVQTNQMN